MRKQRNSRGKLSRKEFTQVIIESPKKKDGKPNPRYPGMKQIVHAATDKSADFYYAELAKTQPQP